MISIRIEDLYDRYAHLLYRRCLALLGNPADAEDALQEVFVRAMRAADSFRGESAPSTWLYRICTNHCLNLIRSSQRRRLRQERRAQDPDRITHTPAEQMENAALIRELLPAFDRKAQELAIYYFVDEMNQQEVAEAMGLSVPTVRKRLKKFIAKAQKILSKGADFDHPAQK